MSDDADPERTKVVAVDPLVGSVLDRRYKVEFKLATGGFGAIYRATQVSTGRQVALKVLHARLAKDPAVIQRFRREGAALARLRDPHTIIAYDVGEAPDGTLYIAMELLHGESLFEQFRARGPLPWRRIVQIARAVCSSLREAHALGIVHRDLKPTNIHLEHVGDEADFVKVLDFGIAKIVQGGGSLEASDLTRTGQMIGTFDYMAPEQMVGGVTSGQSDIFTLGVVMYEMISGVRPFGDHDTPAAMLSAVLSETPAPLSSHAPVPRQLDDIIARCLKPDRLQRYADVGELAGDLDHLLAETDDEPAITARMSAQRGATPDVTDRTEALHEEGTWIDDAPLAPPPSARTMPGVQPPRPGDPWEGPPRKRK